MFTRNACTAPLLATAAVVTAALTLTACGSAGSATSDGGTAAGKVTLWMYPVIKDETASKKFWQDTEAGFEKANPGIDLTIELQTFDKRGRPDLRGAGRRLGTRRRPHYARPGRHLPQRARAAARGQGR